MSSHHSDISDTYCDARELRSGEDVDIVVFHGSRKLFSAFQPNAKAHSPGIWFCTNREYVRYVGDHVYTCRVRAANLRVLKMHVDADFITRQEAVDSGIGAQLMDFCGEEGTSMAEAYLVVTDPSDIEILGIMQVVETSEPENDVELYSKPDVVRTPALAFG